MTERKCVFAPPRIAIDGVSRRDSLGDRSPSIIRGYRGGVANKKDGVKLAGEAFGAADMRAIVWLSCDRARGSEPTPDRRRFICGVGDLSVVGRPLFYTAEKPEKYPGEVGSEAQRGAFWPTGRRRKGRADLRLAGFVSANSRFRSFRTAERRYLAKAAWAAAKRAIGTRNGEQLT
jgi:hypothetical protein